MSFILKLENTKGQSIQCIFSISRTHTDTAASLEHVTTAREGEKRLDGDINQVNAELDEILKIKSTPSLLNTLTRKNRNWGM